MQLTISSDSQGGLPEATQALLLKKALKQEQASQQRLIESAVADSQEAEPQSAPDPQERVGRYLNALA